MCKRWIALFLAVCMLSGVIPAVSAASTVASHRASVTTAESLQEMQPVEDAADVVTYALSPLGAEFIAEMEGCSTQMLDADALTQCENAVNAFITAYGLSVTQAQFDALVDLRYQCPDSFDGLSQFTRLLIANDYVDAELSGALCQWSMVDGVVDENAVSRRQREAKLFLYSDYNGEIALDETAAQTRSTGDMTLSEDGIEFIKIHEGFTQYAQWDYSQWSIGYGSACNPDDYPNGITREEADALLREYVKGFEDYVNRFMRKNNVTFNRNQFDAMVIFSYGCGPAWTSGCRMTRWILNPTTELEFVDAMGAWCHAGGSVLSGLVRRRILEAKIFLYGDYTGNNSPNYTAICFWGNGGTMVDADRDHDILYYNADQPYGSFLAVRYDGYTLEGWYDRDTGKRITTSTIADEYRVVNAKWVNSGLNFTDILSNAWYYPYVKEACEAKLFSGTSETTFSPDESMSRAMLVSVLYRLAGKPNCSGNLPFTDVASGTWYTDSVTWAYQNKIISGVDQTTFAPDAPVTREQTVAILYRYAKYKGYDTSKSTSLSSFSDAGTVSAYAVPAFQWAVAMDVIHGVQDGSQVNLAPKGSTTRAQAATMMVGFMHTYNIQ